MSCKVENRALTKRACTGHCHCHGHGHHGSAQSKLFHRVEIENIPDLELILKNRLPISANIFNIARNHSKWSTEVKWYCFAGEVSLQSWIVATYKRDGLGQEISVSRPAAAEITVEIKEAFSSSNFMNWSEPFIFVCVDTRVSAMVTEISVRENGNYTRVHPSTLYYMEIEDGLQLSDKFTLDECCDPGFAVEVKSMNNVQGQKFLLDTWNYSATQGLSQGQVQGHGSVRYFKDVLERNLSAGFYVNGKIVSGVVFSTQGLLSNLYSLSEYRAKGYARAAMEFIIKRSAEAGFIPCCTVERRNETLSKSQNFQTKIGFKVAGRICSVVYDRASL